MGAKISKVEVPLMEKSVIVVCDSEETAAKFRQAFPNCLAISYLAISAVRADIVLTVAPHSPDDHPEWDNVLSEVVPPLVMPGGELIHV